MAVLLLISALRSGSHMVRSMLRSDPAIRDAGGEHRPLPPAAIGRLGAGPQTVLVPLKYGHHAFTGDCLALAAAPGGRALVLHRRDAAAQARSLAHARRHGSWLAPQAGTVKVDPAEAAALADRNARDLAAIVAALAMPHTVLAYEDITVATLGEALSGLLGRPVRVAEPTTVKIAGAFDA